MSKLYPAHFKEWDTPQGTEYSIYFRDFPLIYVKSNSFIDAVRDATDAVNGFCKNANFVTKPSEPKHGDIMIELSEVTNHGND